MRLRHPWFAITLPSPGARDSGRSPASLATRAATALLALFGLVGAASRVSAATYYVDQSHPSCSNSGAGTQTQPYCTISAAITARSAAGNTIIVKPGVYREQVTIAASGTPGNPLVVQASGPGVQVLGSSSFATPAQWTLFSGNVYLAAGVTASPTVVVVNNRNLWPATSSTTPAALPEGRFKYVSGQGLYVNVGGANPGSQGAEVGMRSYGFRLDRRSWVTIKGFDVRYVNSRNVYLTGPLNNTILEDNRFLYSGKNGVAAIGCSAIVVRNNDVAYHLDHGIMFQDTRNSTIEGNDAYENYRPDVRAANGIYLNGSSDNLIQRNRCHHNQDTGLNLTSNANRNLCLQNLLYFNGDHGTDHTNCDGNIHIGDVAYRNYKDGFSVEGDTPNHKIFNCIGVENGIAVQPADGPLEYNLWVDDTSSPGFQSDYNLWWNSNPSIHPIKYISTKYLTVSSFASATGHDAHSVQADPRFVDPNNYNFRLSDGSPAIDRANSSVAGFPATDFAGIARNDDPATPNRGVGPVAYAELGAYEFAPNVPPVARLTVDPDNGIGPLPVVASGAASTDEGSIVSYTFDFGDGTVVGPQASPTANHVYQLGNWALTLTVTDNRGGTDTSSVPVTVTANLVGNPSFESNTNGWGPTTGTTLSRVSGGFDGGFSAQLAGPATGTATFGLNDSPNWINGIGAVNTRYRFTAWVRSATHTGKVKLQVREFNNNVLQATSSTAEVPLTTGWQLLSVDHLSRMVGSTLDFQVINRPNVTSEVFQVDNVTARVVQFDRPPVVTAPSTVNAAELQPFEIVVTAVDPDGEPAGFTADLSGLPAGHNATFTVDSSNTSGTLRWTPTYRDGRASPYPVTFRASNTLTGSATMQIQVADVDPRPVVTAPAAMTASEGSPVSFQVTATDPDSTAIASLTAHLAGLPAGHNAVFTAAPGNASGTFTWTPTYSDAPGVYSVVFTATNTLSASDTTVISVGNVDLPPVVTAPARFVAGEGAASTMTVTVADPDGQPIDSLRADLSGLPAGHGATFAVDSTRTTGTLAWTPALGTPPGPYRVTFRAGNALVGRDTTDVVVNRRPVVTAPATATVGEGRLLTLQISVSDADGDSISALTAQLSGLPAGHDAVFTPGPNRTTGTLTWTPTAADGRAAPYAVSFTAAAGTLTGGATTQITVDQPPVVTAPAAATVTESELLTVHVAAADPDGQAIATLAADLSQLPAGHDAVFTAAPDRRSGTLTWRPTAADGRIGPYTVTFTAGNALSGSTSTAITVDQPPVVTVPAGPVAGSETAPLTLSVSAADPDGQPIDALTADLSTLPSGHNATFTPAAGNGSATLAWTPTHEDSGTWVVRITASNALSSGSALATIHVANVDRPPVLTAPAARSVGEGELLTATVTVSDPDGDAIASLTADLSALPAGHDATFTPAAGNASGTLTWRPRAGDGGRPPFVVGFHAANALTATGSTAITVDRHPVVTAPATASATENQELQIHVSATDPDGEPIATLAADLSGLPAGHGAVFTPAAGNASGTLRWTPDWFAAPGPYVVRFVASNALGGSSSTSVSIANVDRAPVLECPAVAMGGERQLITLTVTAVDPDREPIAMLAADLSGLPNTANPTFTPSGDNSSGVLSWTPAPGDGDAGPYIVTFMASNALETANATAIIVDRYPRITAPATASIQETFTLTVPISVADPDQDEVLGLTADLSELPAGHDGVFTSAPDHESGTFTWTPTYDDARAQPYRIRFIARNALAETTTTEIAVIQRDRPPVVTAPPSSIGGEGSQITLAVAAADPEGDPIDALTADLSGLPSGHGASFTAAPDRRSGTFQWTPTPAHAPGPYTVGFSATANGVTSTASVSIRVDRHPVLTAPASVLGAENAAFSVQVTVDDPDADPIQSLTADLSGLPAGHNATFTASPDRRTGTLAWTPGYNDSGGPYRVRVTAANALSVTAAIDLRVANTDRAPVVTSPANLFVAENATVTVPVSVADPDGDAVSSLTVDLSALPSGHDGSFTVNPGNLSGTLTWKPRNGDGRLATYDVVFRAANALVGTATSAIKVDQRPVVTLTPASPTVGEGTPLVIDVTAVDPDGQPITFLTANLSGLPTGHNAVFTTSADKSSGTLTWTPTYTDSRAAAYTVTVTASNSLSAAAAATIRVVNTDRAPVVTAPAAAAGPGESLITVSVTAVDPDGEPIADLSADLSGFPAGHGATFTRNANHTGGTLSWTPSSTVPRGPHAVRFVATNALPGSATTQVSVDQRPVVSGPATATASEGAEITFDVTASDLNGDAITSLTADVSGLPAGHNAVFTPGSGNTAGRFSWTPTYSDAGGPYSVTFTAANALSGSRTVQISVANVDRPPVVTAAATRTIGEGAPLTLVVAAADPDGQTIASLTADLSGLPLGHGATFTENANHAGGTLTWTPGYADAGGPYTVSFTAANALSGSTTTAITVTNTDRAPVVVGPATATGGENTVVTIEVAASDPDNQPISFLTADLAGLPDGHNAVFTPNATRTAGTFTWTPTFDDGRPAPYNITFTAFNGMAGTFTTALTVSDDNRAPVVTGPAAVSVTENSPLTIQVTASDPDGEAIANLTADLSEFPASNRPVFTPNASRTAGTLTWTPTFADGRATPYAVTFIATNSSNGSRVTEVTVDNLDRLPVVTAPASATVIENRTVTIDVSAADPDGEPIGTLTADLSALPAGHGATFAAAAGNATGRFTWTPGPSAVRAAPYSIVFRAANALTGSSTTALTVQPDNVPPAAALSATPAAVVAPALVTLSAAGSTDADGTIASYTFDFGDGQSVGPQASPTASHAYAAGYWTARVITVDNLGGRDTATVGINANLTNLVANPGFESNTTGWAAQGSATLSRVTTGGRSGIAQLQVQGSSSATAVFGAHDSPNVVATTAGVGRRYRFGAWVRSDAHTGRINLEVREFSGTSTQRGVTTLSPGATLSPQWQYLTVDYVVTTAGTNLDLRIVDTPNSASQRWFLDDVSIALVPEGDQAPVVTAPAAVSVVRGQPLTVNVAASDPDGQALTSLLANLSGLPSGHTATFTANPGSTAGTLTWTPTAADIRETPYAVTFTAANALSGSATTQITVTDSSALVNLVSNPGFETDLAGWAAYTGTVSRVSPGRSGSWCVRAQGSSTSSFGIDDVGNTVTGVPAVGTRYRFSAWIRSDNSTRAVKIRIYEVNGTTAVGSTFYSPEVTLSPQWKEVTVDYLSRGAGTSINMKITDYPAASGEVFFIDDVFVALVPAGPVAPRLAAPATALGMEGAPLVVGVTAASQDGQPIGSLTADLSALPAGHNAVFTAGPGNTSGTLSWTPAAAHARAQPYAVTFRAAGSLAATRTVQLSVADSSAGPNLAGNPGFDANTTGWAANGTVTLSRLTTNQRSGAGVLQARGGSSATATFGVHDSPNWVSAVAGVGRVYRFGAWVRGLTATDTGSVALEVREFSGTSTQRGATTISPAATLTLNWQYLTVDYTVTTAGTNLDLRAICTPRKASETWLLDDVTITLLPAGPPPPQAPVVSAPATATVLRRHPVTVSVTAADPDGPAIASLTADLSALPAGHDARFTPNGTNTAGTFTWTPTAADIRPTPYRIVFTASNDLSGRDTTEISVADSATTVNLVANPGFETDLSGWSAYGGGTISRVAGGRSGFCVRAQGSSTSSFGIDDVPNSVTSVPAVGTRYRFTAWIRSDNSTRAVKLRIYELQGGSQIGPTFYSPEVALSPTWQRVTVDYTTQRAGTALSLRITDYPSVSGEVFFIDDVSIEDVTGNPTLSSGDPGTLSAALAATPASGTAPLEVRFDASASAAPGSTVVAYRFDFGDGATAGPQASPVATHTYAAGTWTATVTVENEHGQTGTATARVTAAGAAGANRVANGGFETDLSGWGSYGRATLARVAGGRSGGWALEVRGGSSTTSFGIDDVPNSIPVVAAEGEVYRVSAWVRSPSSRRGVKLRIYEFAGGTQVGKTFYSPEVKLAPEWQLVTVDYTTRQAGTTMSLRLTDYPAVAGEVFLVDDVSIEPLTPAVAGATQAEVFVMRDPAPRQLPTSSARAFAREGAASLRTADGGSWTVEIEGADGPESDGHFPRVTLVHGGRRLAAVEDAVLLGGDLDDNGFEEIEATFPVEALDRLLHDLPPGARRLPLSLEIQYGESRRSVPLELDVERAALAFEARFAPNPFRSTGTLHFAVTRRGPVRAEIFDVNGRRQRLLLDARDLEPGRYRLPVQAQDATRGRMTPGVYFYRIEAREGVLRGRFVLQP